MRNHIFKGDKVRLPDGREGTATLIGTKWIHVTGDDGRKSRHPVRGSDLKSLAPQVGISEHCADLYWTRCDGGITSLGFDVCERRIAGYVDWMRRDDLEAAKRDRDAAADPASLARAQGRVRELETGKGRPYWQEDAPRGTLERFAQYELALSQVAVRCKGGKRCDAELTPQLIGLEGKRVEVVDSYGERRRFKVGKSTGFVPIHLELASESSMGGGGVMGAPFQSVRVVS